MLDLKLLREQPEQVKQALATRGVKIDLDGVLKWDSERRRLIVQAEGLKTKLNKANEEIAALKAKGQSATAQIQKMRTVSKKIDQLDDQMKKLEGQMKEILLNVPNLPHPSLPMGAGREQSQITRSWGEVPRFPFKPKTHLELGERLGILDMGRAAKITGSHFVLFTQAGARLQRALINLMLDLHTSKHGYQEVWPPSLVNRASMTGTGQLPKFEEDMYRLKDDDLFLVPTAEVPLTNLYRDEMLQEADLPIYLTAYTPCFRREAGSYGKETKGLIRVHQFDKVELVKFVTPQTSYDELERLVRDAEEVLQLLELPYRVVMLSTGDLGFAAAKCYDLEAYAPGIDMWLEVSSCSNFEAYQARRANIRYRKKGTNKVEFVHTLNGSGVALARTVLALLEIHQHPDSSVRLPKALIPYMSGQTSLRASG